MISTALHSQERRDVSFARREGCKSGTTVQRLFATKKEHPQRMKVGDGYRKAIIAALLKLVKREARSWEPDLGDVRPYDDVRAEAFKQKTKVSCCLAFGSYVRTF